MIVVFDGVCNLCNGSVQFIYKRDPSAKVRFASMQSPPGQELLKRYGYSCEGLDTLLVVEDGQLYVRSDAIRKICGALGGIYGLLGAVFGVFPRVIRDWLYLRVALNRYRIFGKREECMLPTPDLRRRFVNEVAEL